MKKSRSLSRILALWLTLGLALPRAVGASPEPASETLRAMSGEGAGAEEVEKRLAPTASGLAEKEAEEEFIRGVADGLIERLGDPVIRILDELKNLEKLMEAADEHPEMDVKKHWVPLLEMIGEWADEFNQQESLQDMPEQLDTELGTKLSQSAEWRRYERYLRYRLREMIQRSYGLALTMTEQEIPPEEIGEPRTQMARGVYIKGMRDELVTDILEHLEQISAGGKIPRVKTSLSDEEVEKVVALQEELWKHFGPIGQEPLPSMYLTEEGWFFHPHPLWSSAELMKEAGVGPGSHAWDLGGGMGHQAILAAVVFGARATSVEIVPEWVEAGRRFRRKLAESGLLPRGLVRLWRGDLFKVEIPSGVTHTLCFPSMEPGVLGRLDDLLANRPGAAPGTRHILLASEEGTKEEIAVLWPQLTGNGQWESESHWPAGVIFTKKASSGAEEEVPTLQDFLRKWADHKKDHWVKFQLAEDQATAMTRGFWLITEEVRIPWNDPALMGEGIRVVVPKQEEGVEKGLEPENYLKLRLVTGSVRELIVDPVGPGFPNQLAFSSTMIGGKTEFGGVAIRETEDGVVISPAGGKTMLWLQHVPAALALTPEDESRQAELIELRHSEVAKAWVESTETLVTTPAPDEQTVQLIPASETGGVRFDRVLIHRRGQARPLEGFLVAAIPGDRYSRERLEEILGFVEGEELARIVSIRFEESDHLIRVNFQSNPSHGELRIYCSPEYVGSLPLTLLLLERLVARLLEEREPGPSFGAHGQFVEKPAALKDHLVNDDLREALWEVIGANLDATKGVPYRARFLAMVQLAYDPGFNGVGRLLRWLREEPSAPIRRAVLRHLFRRHDEHPALAFNDEQRLEVREVAGGLMAGGPESRTPRDASEFVRAAAVRLLARMTPKSPLIQVTASVTALESVMRKADEKGWVREEARRMRDILLAQERTGHGPPAKLGGSIPSYPDDWQRQILVRHFERSPEGKLRELVVGVEKEGEVKEATAKILDLKEGQEVYAVEIPDSSPIPTMVRLLFHEDLEDLIADLPPGQFVLGRELFRLARPAAPSEGVAPSAQEIAYAQGLCLAKLKEMELTLEDLVLLNLAHVDPRKLKEWVPMGAGNAARAPTVIVEKNEKLTRLTLDELILLQIVALTRLDRCLYVAEIRQTEIDGKRMLLIYV